MVKFRSFIGVACAAIAIANAMSPAVAQEGETVTKHFEQAIPNIPGKSLVAVVADYAPGGASPSHTHAKSAFIFAYVVSGKIESQVNDGPKRVTAPAKVSSRCRVPAILSAAMRARPNRQSCLRFLWSTRTTKT